jgi:hypothetical protein
MKIWNAAKHVELDIVERYKTRSPKSMHGCICLICNEYRDEITNYHAQSHGFRDRDDMILKGKVRFMNKLKEIKMENRRKAIDNPV